MIYLINYLERTIFNHDGTKEILLKVCENKEEYEILEYSDSNTKQKYKRQFEYLEESCNLDNIYNILTDDLKKSKAFVKETLEKEGSYSSEQINSYLKHLKSIENSVPTIQEKIVAILQDILTDTSTEYKELVNNFGSNTAMAVDFLRKQDDEIDEDYANRTNSNLLIKNILEINSKNSEY